MDQKTLERDIKVKSSGFAKRG